jgi:tRNA (guanine-N7-)-methyltransferase
MARLVPDRSLLGVHVYFPDPWWKTRHKKRRVFTGGLVREIERTLVPGGQLSVASDVLEYFGVIRGLIAESGRFQEQELPAKPEPAHALDYLTHFERKYRLEGRPIYQALYTL